MRHRFTPLRMILLSSVASVVFVLGMFLSTGMVSAHTASTASAHTAASTQMASDNCDFGDCFNNCGFDCGFGNNVCEFDIHDCFSSCTENGCFAIPHNIFRHHRFFFRHFHHRCRFFNDFECS